MNAPYSEGTNSSESRTSRPPVDVRGGVAGGGGVVMVWESTEKVVCVSWPRRSVLVLRRV